MTDEINLMMKNLQHDPPDLVHQVTSFKGDVWQCPYEEPNSLTARINIYKKYRNLLPNLLFLKVEPQTSAFDELVKRAIRDKLIVFECNCFPEPCHLDILRLELTKVLQSKGFKVNTNGSDAYESVEKQELQEHAVE